MSMSRTVVGDLAIEAIKRSPKAATQSLAKALHAQHPEVFTSVEQARTAVRYARGAHGTSNRKKVSKRLVSLTRTKSESEECRRWGALLPKAKKTKWRWHDIPESVGRWLVFADVHIPFHDDSAVEAMFRHADGNCDGAIILGDKVDCYEVSEFCRDPRQMDFVGMIEQANAFLDALQSLNLKHIVYKAGNHELRLEHYLMKRAPELFPLISDAFSLPKLLKLQERGIEWVRPQDPLRHHQLALVHGNEWGKGFIAPVNPARGAFLRAGDCVVSAHLHRRSNHAERSLQGRLVQCWSIGCLCDLHPDYAPINKWDQGFGYLNAGSEWSFDNHSIINGRVH